MRDVYPWRSKKSSACPSSIPREKSRCGSLKITILLGDHNWAGSVPFPIGWKQQILETIGNHIMMVNNHSKYWNHGWLLSMAMTQEPIDWRYLPHTNIYKAYFSGLNFREYPPKKYSQTNMVRLRTSSYLHKLDPESFPLKMMQTPTSASKSIKKRDPESFPTSNFINFGLDQNDDHNHQQHKDRDVAQDGLAVVDLEGQQASPACFF